MWRVPNQPATQNRSIRFPDEMWDAVLRIADGTGETATDVVLRAVRYYLREHPGGD